MIYKIAAVNFFLSVNVSYKVAFHGLNKDENMFSSHFANRKNEINVTDIALSSMASFRPNPADQFVSLSEQATGE